MKRYISFFKLRFINGLQYRGAALAGIATQFAWGGLQILMYKAFYIENSSSFPMGFSELSNYIWLQQSFLSLYMIWFMESEIFNTITSGNITYELSRPMDIYNMWFARSVANRLARAILRCVPILVVAAFLPYPYGMSLPKSFGSFLLFIFTLFIAFLLAVAFCMIVYMICFFTVSPMGVRLLAVCLGDLLAGSIVPLPFFPDNIRWLIELLPFASMQNIPLRIYSGNIAGEEALKAVIVQLVWLVLLVLIGKSIGNRAMRKLTVLGG